jgi:hypothetical protein
MGEACFHPGLYLEGLDRVGRTSPSLGAAQRAYRTHRVASWLPGTDRADPSIGPCSPARPARRSYRGGPGTTNREPEAPCEAGRVQGKEGEGEGARRGRSTQGTGARKSTLRRSCGGSTRRRSRGYRRAAASGMALLDEAPDRARLESRLLGQFAARMELEDWAAQAFLSGVLSPVDRPGALLKREAPREALTPKPS